VLNVPKSETPLVKQGSRIDFGSTS